MWQNVGYYLTQSCGVERLNHALVLYCIVFFFWRDAIYYLRQGKTCNILNPGPTHLWKRSRECQHWIRYRCQQGEMHYFGLRDSVWWLLSVRENRNSIIVLFFWSDQNLEHAWALRKTQGLRQRERFNHAMNDLNGIEEAGSVCSFLWKCDTAV